MAASAQFYSQQGGKLVGAGAIYKQVPTNAIGVSLGWGVALSGDGNTALAGAPDDNGGIGAAWVFVRQNGVAWTQQGNKLVPSDTSSFTSFGQSVALSADGNTALIGGPSGMGAAWVFTRASDGNWTQQGSKLVGTVPANPPSANSQGGSVALSADGNTALVGGASQNGCLGWVFTRASNETWMQQGSELVGSGAVTNNTIFTQFSNVTLSADGNTAAVSAPLDNSVGAVWVFTRTSGQWNQQGSKLVASGGVTSQGISVALSADGNTLLEGTAAGAAVVFVRDSSGNWTQQGGNLVGTDTANANLGQSVALSGDGNTALLGGPNDNGGIGAAWVFTRDNNGNWTQAGNKLVGTGSVYAIPWGVSEGVSVALSADASTALVGGPNENNLTGAVWPFIRSSDVFSWIPGSLTQVAVGADGSVWGINEFEQIYTWDASTSSWINIPGSLAQIAVGSSGAVWGINYQQHIYEWDSAQSQWRQIPGLLKQIAVGADGDVWGLDAASGIWHYNAQAGYFSEVPGALTQIVAGSAGTVYGLNANGGIYWYNIGTQVFQQIAYSSRFSQIAVGVDGDLWAVKDAVAYHYDVLHNTMDTTPGSITQVTLGFGAAVFGLNAGGQIYQWNAVSGNWVEIPGNLHSIAAGANGSVWGINSSQQIYQFGSPTRQPQGLLFVSPTSLSQIYVGADGSVWGLAASANYPPESGPQSTNTQVEYFNAGTQSFENVPGAPELVELSVGAGADVWGLDASGNIYQYEADVGTWNNIPGNLSSIQVGADGSVWGLNSGGAIYTYNFFNNTWTHIPGQLSMLALGKDGSVWGVNQYQQIYHFDVLTQTWVNIPGSLVSIWVGSEDNVWGENVNGHFSRFDSGTQAWINVPNIPAGISGCSVSCEVSVSWDGSVWATDNRAGLYEWNAATNAFNYVGTLTGYGITFSSGYPTDVFAGSAVAVWATVVTPVSSSVFTWF